MPHNHYIIRGGIEGRERLRILSRVMQATSHNLLDRAGLRPGMSCLEIGCGSGDLAFDMAHRVGPFGKVLGTDIDETKIELAREEATTLGLSNVEFQLSDIAKEHPDPAFDLVHARFVLTHLPDPAHALDNMRRALKPGGVAVVEDIDFRGCFCHPFNAAFDDYIDLYTRTVESRGGDANIGPRLPALLRTAGFEHIQMNAVMPAGIDGEVKLLAPITLENIAEAVAAEGLATEVELKRLIAELHDFASHSESVVSAPRIVEAWGRVPEA
jgi:ubiquinone/menaquinone biosynthesis C-methylase UbiE